MLLCLLCMVPECMVPESTLAHVTPLTTIYPLGYFELSQGSANSEGATH